MFETKNPQLLHKEAVNLIIENLPGAVDMDSISGYDATYHIEWKNIKLLVKVARPSKKKGFKIAYWHYALREKDHIAADYFTLLALLNSKLEAVFVIPKLIAPRAYITITKLNGNMRYSYFRTTLADLPQKILRVQARLPKIISLYRKEKSIKGGGV